MCHNQQLNGNQNKCEMHHSLQLNIRSVEYFLSPTAEWQSKFKMWRRIQLNDRVSVKYDVAYSWMAE